MGEKCAWCGRGGCLEEGEAEVEGEEERVLEDHERGRTWVMSLAVPLVESNQRAMLVDDAGGYRGVIWEKIGGVLALDKVHPAARRRWARRVCFCT